jgi:PncC family amidohydrolase
VAVQAYETRGEAVPYAVRLGALVEQHGWSIAIAESVTGGALTEALVPVAGSSRWLAGGVVAYMSRIKRELLDVQAARVISGDAAQEMAIGVARLFGTDVGLATTGVAGPETIEEQPVGTVWIGVSVFDRVTALHLRLDGGPDEVRMRTVRAALVHAADWLARALPSESTGRERPDPGTEHLTTAARVGQTPGIVAFE